METMYAEQRQALFALIHAINPNLDKQQTSHLALFVSSSIEGMTMFVGAGKKQEGALESMKKIASQSFLLLIAQPKKSGAGSRRRHAANSTVKGFLRWDP